MLNSSFHSFLKNLSFTDEDLSVGFADENTFEYEVDPTTKLSVKYILTPTEDDIFKAHKLLWNKNSDNVFVAVTEQKSHIINVKEKPDANRTLKNAICLKTFEYGVNTIGFENVKPSEISKQYVDSAFFFDFVSKNQRKGQQVDKDLLLNLLALKNDLITEDNDEFVHLLILRCLFIKYLEDRGIFEQDYLLNILKSQVPQNLVAAFDEIRKINGDVFKFDNFEMSDIRSDYLKQLALFFETDYRSGQMFLFPYMFDQIPIQLISHVYEAFLKENNKKQKGIYYTPPFLVKFMLDAGFKGNLQNQNAKCLDPAVGSGAFLVETFRAIQQANGGNLKFKDKKRILEEQLYGIDVDRKALQIAAFSLYLALLETEEPSFIKNEIIHAHPILPSLIGKTLIHGNALTDNIFEGVTFDYIVSNPPWGTATEEEDDSEGVISVERNAINNIDGNFPEYRNVANYERSQAFMMRVARWSNSSTTFVMVVKNSIFLNDKAYPFRKELLTKYKVDTFYELSHYNKILFKKAEIGRIKDQKVEIGASEPCAVIIFNLATENTKNNELNYISPKLTPFAERFDLIKYSAQDSFKIVQNRLSQFDNLWKVLVNGDYEDFELINSKLVPQKNLDIEARSGIKPKQNMAQLGEPRYLLKIEPQDFTQYQLCKDNLVLFNVNQEMERDRKDKTIFNGKRLLVPVRPLKPDRFRFRAIYLEDEYIFKHNIISLKFRDGDTYVDSYLPYLGIINSQLMGYLFYHLSIQWGKGEGKRDTLRNIDVERLPLKKVNDLALHNNMTQIVEDIQRLKSLGKDHTKQIEKLDNLVFDHYGLLEYEKEIIREFYDTRLKPASIVGGTVKASEMGAYFKAFTDTFSLILSDENTLKSTYSLSPYLGAVISISIVNRKEVSGVEKINTSSLLNFVKSGQLKKAEALKVLNEDKVKIYEDNNFYIIKSNQFKDWTVRQAIKDAREEIEQFIKHLTN